MECADWKLLKSSISQRQRGISTCKGALRPGAHGERMEHADCARSLGPDNRPVRAGGVLGLKEGGPHVQKGVEGTELSETRGSQGKHPIDANGARFIVGSIPHGENLRQKRSWL